MAQTVHLLLEINGNRINGESSVSSMEREDTIECLSFRHVNVRPGPTGKKRFKPIKIQKRIDKSTPLLLKALYGKEPVTRALFSFFRPDPSGSGAEEKFYTVLLENGSVVSVRQSSEDNITGGENASPMLEEIGFTYETITWTYENGGITYTETLR